MIRGATNLAFATRAAVVGIASPPDRLLLAVLAVILLWPAPHLESLRSPNEMVRLYSTRALVDDHTLAIDAQIRNRGALTDRAVRDGHAYSDKAPGLSLLATPVYALLRVAFTSDQLSNRALIRILRTVWIVVPTILWLGVLGVWLRRLDVGATIAASCVVAYALGTPAFAYNLKWVGHQAAGWMLGLALASAWFGRASSSRLRFAAGLLAGLAGITEYPTLPMLPLIALLASYRAPRPWRGLLLVGLGALVPLGVGAVYHTLAFGGPLTTGYSFIVNPAFKHVHESGLMGVGLPNVRALFAITFGTQRGMFVLAPWLVLVPAVLLELRAATADRLLIGVLVANVAGLLWVASGFGYWIGGWSVGPRHLVSSLPAMTVLAALGWRRLIRVAPRVDIIIRGLVVAACVACCAAALTFPGFPEELVDPLFEMALAMLARAQFSYSIGTGLGLSSSWGMLPAVIAVAAVASWVGAGAPRRGADITTALWRCGAGAWVAVLLLVGLSFARSTPSPEAVFRTAWLTQTKWSPQDVDHHLDPRLAAWEHATHAIARNNPHRVDYRALGAVAARRGDARGALDHYARAAWGSPVSPAFPGFPAFNMAPAATDLIAPRMSRDQRGASSSSAGQEIPEPLAEPSAP